MKISLPIENVELWRNSHEFAWLFRRHFSFFPDRDGSFMSADLNKWIMNTNQKITGEQEEEIKNFCMNPVNFTAPTYSNLLILDLNFIEIENQLKEFLNEKDFIFIGKGHEQHIYFLRALTTQEKKQAKEVLLSHVNIY